MKNVQAAAALVAALVMTAACGGDGGGGGPLSPAGPTATPTPTPAPTTSSIEVRSTDTPRSIGNLATLDSDLVVVNAGTITDLSVEVNAEHTWRGDLEIDLRHPDGTVVRLFTGAPGDNRDNVVEVFTRSNTPDLSRLLNKSVSGTWRLSITDRAPLDKGTLGFWVIRATVRS